MKLQIRCLSLRAALAGALVAALGLAVGAPTAASAKRKAKDRCARADARLAATGKGDKDADGLSNCRERMLGTSLVAADSDSDGLDDAEEVTEGCDPNAPDSDDDGIPDGEDPTPAPPPAEQKLEAFLDALTCPQTGVPGSLTALGVTVVLDDATEFEDTTCEELAAALAVPETVRVEVKLLEDEAGGLLATEVERDEHHDWGDHDFGDDDGHDDGDVSGDGGAPSSGDGSVTSGN